MTDAAEDRVFDPSFPGGSISLAEARQRILDQAAATGRPSPMDGAPEDVQIAITRMTLAAGIAHPNDEDAAAAALLAMIEVRYKPREAMAGVPPDRVVDPADAVQLQSLLASMWGWFLLENQPAYPGKFIARLTAVPPPANPVIVADTLEELRALLPPGLERSNRTPDDPPDEIESWNPA